MQESVENLVNDIGAIMNSREYYSSCCLKP